MRLLLTLAGVLAMLASIQAANAASDYQSDLLKSLAYHEVIDIEEHPVLYPQRMTDHQLRLHAQGSHEELVRHPHHVEFKFQAHGRDFHLRLLKNHHLLHPEYRTFHIVENHKSIVKHRRKDIMHCYYLGQVLGDPESLVAVSTCKGLDGFIETSTEHYHIKPAAPHTQRKFKWASIEKPHVTTVKHIIYKTKDLPESSRPPFKCGVGNEDPSFKPAAGAPPVPESCVQRQKRREQAAETLKTQLGMAKLPHDHTHEHDHDHGHDHEHGHGQSSADPMKLGQHARAHARERTQSHLGVLYPEMVVVNDLSRFQYHGIQTETHTLGLFNAVIGYYQNSGGSEISSTLPSLTAQVTWTTTNEIPVTLNGAGHIEVDNYLSNFASWQSNSANYVPLGETAPPKDNAALLSGSTFRDSIVGYAYTWQMCITSTSAAINQADHVGYEAFDSATIAHELGHNLGMCHDPSASRSTACADVTGLSCSGYIMSASSSISSPNNRFSSCSEADYALFVNGSSPVNSFSSCIQNAPTVLYNNTEECGDGFVQGSEQCDCKGYADCSLAPAPWTDSCCSPNCTFVGGATCSDAQPCCEGCQVVPSSTKRTCRAKGAGAATEDCDEAEYCNGVDVTCPPDQFEGDGQSCPTDLAAVAAEWIEDNYEILAIGGAAFIGLIIAYKCVCKCWSCCCGDGKEVSGKRVVRQVVRRKGARQARRHQQGVEMAAGQRGGKVAMVGGIALPPWWQVRYTRDGVPVYINLNTGHMYDFRHGPPRAVHN